MKVLSARRIIIKLIKARVWSDISTSDLLSWLFSNCILALQFVIHRYKWSNSHMWESVAFFNHVIIS